MKKPRNKLNRKVLGIAIGESALLLAEVTDGGERPAVSRVAEFTYPQGMQADRLPEMTPDIVKLVREKGFTARTMVVGLPAKWLVVKPKDIPVADEATQLSMLRLQADADFSSELKDLAYDVAGKIGVNASAGSPVLLVATARKFVQLAEALCAALGGEARAITASALALGEESRRSSTTDALVLSMGSGGTELTAQRSGATTALRRIAAANGSRPSMGELRRVLSSLSATDRGKEIVLWEALAAAPTPPEAARADVDWELLSQQLGLQFRAGTLGMLRASGPTSLNGDSAKYAPAIALGIAGAADRLPIDFLHTRLAPPPVSRIPRWAAGAGLAVAMLIALVLWGVHDLSAQAEELQTRQNRLDSEKARVKLTDDFVSRVSFAQGWHAGDPRYLACLRALTRDMPDDSSTYAISLEVRETPKPPGAVAATPGAASPVEGPRTLTGQLHGKAADQRSGQAVIDQLSKDPLFRDVKSGGTNEAGREHDVSFSISFIFVPSATKP